MKVPCHDCADRVVGCHSECERYKEYAEECHKRREERHLDAIARMNSPGRERGIRKKLMDKKANRKTNFSGK